MDKVKQFFELKARWKQSPEGEREAIDVQITQLLNSMNEAETSQLEIGIQQDFENIHKEATDIEEQLSIRERLAPVLPFISISNLSKIYFNRSSSWFYQRLNGNLIHGKVSKFTDDELKTLEGALQDISNKINSLQLT